MSTETLTSNDHQTIVDVLRAASATEAKAAIGGRLSNGAPKPGNSASIGRASELSTLADKIVRAGKVDLRDVAR